MILLLATTNPHKLEEIRTILSDLPLTLLPLAHHGEVSPADEAGETFAEIARAKARHYARATGQVTLAEDSGLAIDALDGRPGIRSARYDGASYPEKFRAIYADLASRTAGARTARFVSAVTLAAPDRILFETVGVVEGLIAPAPRGERGFGYDPIFFYPPYGRTLAEVAGEEKAAVSHRGRALRALRVYLIGLTRAG